MTLEALFTAFVETGDEASLERIFRRCAPALRRHARRLGHAGEDVEDLVQETMVTAVQRADAFRGAEKLLPWLKGILARKAAHFARGEARRKRATRAFAEQHDGDDSSASPGTLGLAELIGLVEDAIPTLPEKFHEPLRLQLLEGKSPAEIARALSMPRTTVRVHLYRGMRLLRQRLPKSVTPGLLLLLLAPSTMAMVGRPRVGRVALATGAVVFAVTAGWFSQAGSSANDASEGLSIVGAMAQAGAVPSGDTDHALDRDAVSVDPGSGVEPGQLEVVVRSVEGDPVPSVGVRVVPSGRDPVVSTRRACTGADGRAVLHGLDATVVDVVLDRGPRARVDLAAEESAVCNLTVAAGLEVRGRIVTMAGSPVPHASVWFGDDTDGPWSGRVVATANGSGEFSLRHVPRGAFIAAFSEDRSRSDVVRIDGDAPVELRLGEGGGVVTGRVVDPDGQPVADAVVLVGESMDGAALRLSDGAAAWRPPPIELRTDANGSFRAARLESDWHPLYVRAVGFAPHARAVHVDADTEIVVRLARGARVVGHVVDDDGVGIGGATVAYCELATDLHCELTSADDGAFSLWIPVASRGTLVARARGHVPQSLEIAGTPPDSLDVRLPSQPLVRGRFVRRGTDEGLAGFWFRCGRSTPERLDDGYVLVESGAEGRFETPPVRHAARLWIRGPGEVLWRDGREFAQWNRDELRIEVPTDWFATGSLEGTLCDDDGLPASRCRLFVTSPGGIPMEVGATDAAGRFSVPGLPGGEYELFAESTGATSPAFTVGTVQVSVGETTRLDRRAPQLGRVTLDLARTDGRELGDAVVTLVGGKPRRRYALLMDGRGTRSLEPGRYELWAMGSRFAWVEGHPFEVRPGAHTRVEIDVAPAVRCKLALAGLPEVAPDAVWRCRVVGLDSGQEHGRYTLAGDAMPSLGGVFPIGRYRLEVHGPDGGSWGADFAVESLEPRWRAAPLELVRAR